MNLIDEQLLAWLGVMYFAAVLPIVLWYAFWKQKREDKAWPPKQEDCREMYWWSPPKKKKGEGE